MNPALQYTQLLHPIQSIQLFSIELPLVHPFTTSFGTQTTKTAILVKITDDNGNVGWGETSVMSAPSYTYETVQTAWHVQQDFLIPILKANNKLGMTIPSIIHAWEKIRGHEFAKAGIESALWALIAEQHHVSLGAVYGATKHKIPTGVSIGIPISRDTNELIQRIQSFLERGYKRIKIKIEPGWDITPVKAIRETFDDIPLMVDANSSYSLRPEHVTTLKALDDYNLMMIEQPLQYNDILEHCILQKQLKTPICLDESIHTVTQADLSLQNNCCRIINIKPGRVGGYWNAIRIADANPGKVWCGGMLETGIGRIHNVFFQARESITIPGDTSGSNRYFNPDVIDPPVIVDKNGFISLPSTPGLGVSVNEDLILQHTKHKNEYHLL